MSACAHRRPSVTISIIMSVTRTRRGPVSLSVVAPHAGLRSSSLHNTIKIGFPRCAFPRGARVCPCVREKKTKKTRNGKRYFCPHIVASLAHSHTDNTKRDTPLDRDRARRPETYAAVQSTSTVAVHTHDIERLRGSKAPSRLSALSLSLGSASLPLRSPGTAAARVRMRHWNHPIVYSMLAPMYTNQRKTKKRAEETAHTGGPPSS